MKKLFALLIVVGLLGFACNNNKTSKNLNSNNREKDDYGKSGNRNNDDVKKNDETSGEKPDENTVEKPDENTGNSLLSGWPQAERDAFKTNCEKNAVGGGISVTLAKNYCDCMLNYMESQYPNVLDAGKLTDEDLETPEMKKIIKECLGLK
jgi:hypothetical protein